jgi:hypothetical protein
MSEILYDTCDWSWRMVLGGGGGDGGGWVRRR